MNTLTPLKSTEEAAQAIFDWFKLHNAVFGFCDERDMCIYRGDENPASNVRCAFGCLIPNEIYKEAMSLTSTGANPRGIEGKNAEALLIGEFETTAMKMYFANVDRRFLNIAQQIHDKNSNRKNTIQHFLAEYVLTCKTEFDITIQFS